MINLPPLFYGEEDMQTYEVQTKLTNELLEKILINHAVSNESDPWGYEYISHIGDHQLTESHKVKVTIKVEDA